MTLAPSLSSPPSIALHATVLRSLSRRGVSLERTADETSDGHQARIETALMALFRDERSDLAFEALYRFSHATLLSWIQMSSHRRATSIEPTEVLQDAFVNMYRYAGTFRDERAQSFRVWSRTIAANLLRRSKRQLARPSLQALPEGLQEPADTRSVGPENQAMLGEERSSVLRAYRLLLAQYHAAWSKLSDRDREALRLVEVDGYSYAEACEFLNVGMSNMKMIIFRARRRIRRFLLEGLGAEEEAETPIRKAG